MRIIIPCYREIDHSALDLDYTINEFRNMKMQPSLERALKHKEILGAYAPSQPLSSKNQLE